MSRDRSLEEFASESDATKSRGPDRDQAGHESEDDYSEEPSVEPIETTYAFDRSGGTCAECGTSADERWRDGAGLVCPDCKEW